jgi:hypothetical protein
VLAVDLFDRHAGSGETTPGDGVSPPR